MEQQQNKWKLFVTTSVLTFMGMLNLLMLLFTCYDRTEAVSMAGGVTFSIFVALIFSALFVFIKRKWLVWLIYAVLFGMFFWVSREALMGGTASYINAVINEIALYFDTEMYFVEIPKKLLREANVEMSIYVMLMLLASVYSFCIFTKRTAVVPFVVSLVFTVLAMVLEVGTPAEYIYGIVYCMALAIIVMASWNKSFGERNMFFIQLAAIGMGCLILIASMIVSSVKPQEEYRKSEYFNNVYDQGENVYNQFVNGELTINRLIDFFAELLPFEGESEIGFGSASGMASKIGAGELGKVDKLEFSGKEVLQVTMPRVDDKVYIKGYIGGVYSSNQWYEPVYDGEIQQLTDAGIHSQTLAFSSLYILANEGCVDGYAADMTVSYTIPDMKYLFVPLYIQKSSQFTYSGDGGLQAMESPYTVHYLHINESCLGSLDDLWEISYTTDSIYSWYNEEQYRHIAYEKYLDVNTTDAMAKSLALQWGGRSIDSAEDRYSVACDIRQYLKNTCRYSTSPGKVPAEKDFVEYFLTETHEGYCTYFATSAVMMLRSAGIPARYVEGYMFRTGAGTENGEYGSYVEYKQNDYNNGMQYSKKLVTVSVPDSAAHAWVEYYVDGIGWVDFEVTPGNFTQPVEQPTTENSTEETTETDDTKETTTEAETTAPGETDTSSDKTTAISNTGSPSGTQKTSFRIKLSKTAERVLIIAAIFVAVTGVTVVIIVMRYKNMAIIRERMYNGNNEVLFSRNIIMIYDEYMKLVRHFGYKRTKDMSENDFADLLARQCPFVSKSETEQMASLYEKVVFSKEDISVEERDRAAGIIRSVRERMYGNLGIVKKFIYKYVINV